jgi:DNA-binding MarR family transcriptional regulator/ribosomal protein S18 acetylase RimI-like enzyme
MDLIRELGALAIATRLRRLADTLQTDVSHVYDELGVDFQARWFAVLAALRRGAPATVTDLADRLGLSHQAVSKTLRSMDERGLIRNVEDPTDRRRRQVDLTARGRRLGDRLEDVWREIRAANRELLAEVHSDLLSDLDRLEDALAATSMADRVRARLGLDPHDPVRIVDYRPAYKKHFRRLNEAWLGDRFTVEPEDARILADPNGRIIRRGGAVLFALVDDEVAGTCALIRHNADLWELAKMAVAPDHRRRGLGRRLTRAAIARAREAAAPRLWLRTSPHLRAAGRLYRSLGFRRTRKQPFETDAYRRETFAMVLDLDATKE